MQVKAKIEPILNNLYYTIKRISISTASQKQQIQDLCNRNHLKSDILDQPVRYQNVMSTTTIYKEDTNKCRSFSRLNVSATLKDKPYYPHLKSGITNAQ